MSYMQNVLSLLLILLFVYLGSRKGYLPIIQVRTCIEMYTITFFFKASSQILLSCSNKEWARLIIMEISLIANQFWYILY